VSRPIVYVIDDDAAVRDSFHVLFESHGIEIRCYASGEAFLAAAPPLENSCLLIDVNMPELNGVDLISRLLRDGFMTPTFLMTGGGVMASLLSTVDRNDVVLLEKPLVPRELVAEVRKALGGGRTEHRSVVSAPNLKGSRSSSSPHERRPRSQ
jgi:two-component system, LuxR family, response regulator FixJ